MRKLVLILAFLFPLLLAQSDVERRVLENVRKMMTQSGGRVTFSDLINNPDFSTDEKGFLGRLYEIFFQIPAVLKSEFDSTGTIPTRESLGANFGISATSVDLLLAVMRSDPRVPPLFKLNPTTSEIDSLNMPNIEAFVAQRGAQVKVTQWEGRDLPPFDLPTLDGEQVSSGHLKGRNSLIYFWFTGCPPCGRISPHLKELDEKYSGESFRIVGVNADKLLGLSTTDEQRRKYLAKYGIEFETLVLDESTRAAFGGINIFPTLFFADPDGRVVRHFINYQSMEALEGVVREMGVGGR